MLGVAGGCRIFVFNVIMHSFSRILVVPTFLPPATFLKGGIKLDIEKVSDMYNAQMHVQNISKLNLKTDPPKDQQRRKPLSKFDTVEVLAEKLLLLEKRVDDLERSMTR